MEEIELCLMYYRFKDFNDAERAVTMVYRQMRKLR